MNRNTLGISLMLISCFFIAGNSALTKTVLLVYPIVQVLFLRNLFALAVISPLLTMKGVRAVPRPKLQIVRFLLHGAEAILFFLAIAYLPIIDVMTFYLAAPIYVTAFSSAFLGERVGWRRWSAVIVGFSGVIIAIHPTQALLNWPSLIALLGSLLYACTLLVTRELRGTRDSILILTQLSAVLIITATVIPFRWVDIGIRDVAVIAVIGVINIAINLCTNRSLKLAPASVVVPFQYTLLPWGGFFGYIMFGEKPTPHILVGALLIVVAGIYIIAREAKRNVTTEPAIPSE